MTIDTTIYIPIFILPSLDEGAPLPSLHSSKIKGFPSSTNVSRALIGSSTRLGGELTSQ